MQTLYSNGIALDTSPGCFGTLRESNELLGDAAALRVRMSDDGYLFFRGLIDRDTVLAARREILLKYAAIGEIDGRHPVDAAVAATERAIEHVNLRAFTRSVREGLAYEQVVLNPALLSFFGDLLDGQARAYDFRWPRFVRPGEGCGFHCDGPYMSRGTDKLFSAWIPLGDIAMHEGALVVLEKSNRAEFMQGYFKKDADRDGLQWLSTNPLTLQKRFGTRWLSTDLRAGDVLSFTMHTVHGALDNRSTTQRCRLSSDTRYQLADEPFDERWNGPDPVAHGHDKVFYPGLGSWNNRDFRDEWKPVDEHGRLSLDDPQEPRG